MNKIFLIIVIILTGIGAYFTFNNYFGVQDSGNDDVKTYRATLAGEYLCLPHVDQTGPQTEECAIGLKTLTGEYYALDFNLASQTPQQLASGDRVEATGVVTPIEMVSSGMWQKYPIVGIFSVTDSIRKLDDNQVVGCTKEAKICPDGSSVGRTGTKCEFTACPVLDTKSATVSTSLGQTGTGLSVSITPREIVSDSRCPSDVVCVWAGTVSVRAVVATEVAHGEHVFTINDPIAFGDFTVTLTGVMPYPKSNETIPNSAYRLTFEIKKK
jgi:hypothetical protein